MSLLVNAWKTANSQIMPGRHYGYQFDDIGNRISTTRGNNTSDLVLNPQPVVTSDYTPNLLNQYDQRTIPAYAEISGTADENAVLSFKNENSGSQIRAGRNGAWFHTYMPLSDNSSSAVTNPIRMTGVLPGQGTGGKDLINTNQTITLSAMKTPEQFAYDDDGNMLSDQTFTYTWNAENRLIEVDSIAGVSPALSATYKYDHQGRRISKTVNGETTTFLWNGNHIIQESTATSTNSYCWGSDDQLVSATLQTTNPQPQTVFYAHDGNKNVTDLVDSSGDAVARYEFDPFGNLIGDPNVAGSINNPFKFSNEYHDSETGLIAYEQRYLNIPHGIWLSRDPIGEIGGINIYGFVHNNTPNYTDNYGLAFDITYVRFDSLQGHAWIRTGGMVTVVIDAAPGNYINVSGKNYRLLRMHATLPEGYGFYPTKPINRKNPLDLFGFHGGRWIAEHDPRGGKEFMVARAGVKLLGWDTELKDKEYELRNGSHHSPWRGKFVYSRFEYGKAKGSCCKKASREDVLDCVDAYLNKKANQFYQFPFWQCRGRAKDALDACCLKVGDKIGTVPSGSVRAEYDPTPSN